ARRPRRCCAAASRSSRCGGRSTTRSKDLRWRAATRRPSGPRAWRATSAGPQPVRPETLVVNERRYPGRIGQTYGITYDPGQRWYWFPHMRPDEALVFKVFESLKDGRARWTAHTAFEDPTSPPHP